MFTRRVITTGLATMLLGTALFVGGGAVAADTDTGVTAVSAPPSTVIGYFDGRGSGDDTLPTLTSSTNDGGVTANADLGATATSNAPSTQVGYFDGRGSGDDTLPIPLSS